MKKLIFQFTLPMTLISFGIITKWWFGFIVDGKDVFLYGFPLIYKSQGLHTSLSSQYFIVEMMINILVYFIYWFAMTLILNRFWEIKIPKSIVKTFWIGFGVFLFGFLYFSNEFNDLYFIKRDFDIKIIDSGFAIFEYHLK